MATPTKRKWVAMEDDMSPEKIELDILELDCQENMIARFV